MDGGGDSSLLDRGWEIVKLLWGALTVLLAMLYRGMDKRVSDLEEDQDELEGQSVDKVARLAVIESRMEGLDKQMADLREESRKGFYDILNKLDAMRTIRASPRKR